MRTFLRDLGAVSCMLQLVARPAAAQNEPMQYSSVVGGSGGNTFSFDGRAGWVLAGLCGREGLVVDSVDLNCRTVNANGTLG